MKTLAQNTLTLLLATLLLSNVAAAEKRVLLKMPVYVPTNLEGLGTTPVWLAEQVKAASNNKLRIKLYEPGKLVPPKEILGAVSKGEVNAGFVTAGLNSGVLGNKAAFFSSVPFGPDAPEYLAWIYYGDGRRLWADLYKQKRLDVHSIPCGILAPETSGWFPRPIDKPTDLQGLRMRFFGLGGLVMEKLGVATSQLAGSEIFPALEKGAIDATEFSMPAIDQRLGFYKILKYNYFPGWHQQATLLEMLVNGKTWRSLSAAQQTTLEMACKSVMLDGLAFGEAIQLPVMKKNRERGVENRYWSAEMLTLFEQKWAEVVEEQSAADPGFDMIWKNLKAFRADYAEWNRWAFLPRPGTRRTERSDSGSEESPGAAPN